MVRIIAGDTRSSAANGGPRMRAFELPVIELVATSWKEVPTALKSSLTNITSISLAYPGLQLGTLSQSPHFRVVFK